MKWRRCQSSAAYSRSAGRTAVCLSPWRRASSRSGSSGSSVFSGSAVAVAALSPPATGPLSPPGALTRPCFVTTVSLRWNRGAPGRLAPIRWPSPSLHRPSPSPAGDQARPGARSSGPRPGRALEPPATGLTLSCMGQLSPWKRTIRPVVRYNCYVNLSADDAELVQLLGQLLRVVSPESAGSGHGGPGPGNGGPRPGGGQVRPDGVTLRPDGQALRPDGMAGDGA